jgi:glucuronate isomerase
MNEQLYGYYWRHMLKTWQTDSGLLYYLYQHRGANEYLPAPLVFFGTSEKVHSFSTDRAAFMGNYRDESDPQAIERHACRNETMLSGEPCFAVQVHKKGWTQQFHAGPIRNNNTRLLTSLGPDTGFDSIGDFSQAQSMARFLDKMDSTDQLAKTILYNINPADNEVFATMIGNFQDGSVPGKMQWGSAWWFLDQKDGIEKQLNCLSCHGLLSRFVGMLTDSRSFLSYPRHEYFRRILCNILGTDVENNELPNDITLLGNMVSDICFRNAKQYFGF